MSKREPTAEEILLWREINRTTRKAPPHTQEMPIDAPEKPPVPSAAAKPAGAAPQTVPRRLPKTPLAPLSAREAKKRLSVQGPSDASLDLHGYSRLDAYALVHAFVARHHRMGHRHLVIIPGKGRAGEGVLRTELPHWLNEPTLRGMISAFFNARERDGGAGVVHVMLRANPR